MFCVLPYPAKGHDGSPWQSAVAVEAGMTMHRIAAELVEQRRATPTDDILSMLVHPGSTERR
jgi:cytochrome P450